MSFAVTGGFSLLEMVMVAGLFVLVFATVYQMWMTSSRYSLDLETRFALLSRAQVGVATMTREIQSSRRLLYPAPRDTQPGVTIVDGRGRVVLYALDTDHRTGPDGSGTIVRRELATGNQTTLMKGVRAFDCRVAAPPSGRDPDLVHLSVTLDAGAGRSAYLVTSARLRSLDVRCPVER